MAKQLPTIQNVDRTLSMLQSQWKAILDNLLAAPMSEYVMLSDLKLVSGSNVINHKLGRKLVGYVVTLKSAASDIHDNQTVNTMPDKTLILVASAPVTLSLMVF